MMIYMVPCFSGFLNFHPVLSLASLEELDRINSTLLLPMKITGKEILKPDFSGFDKYRNT